MVIPSLVTGGAGGKSLVYVYTSYLSGVVDSTGTVLTFTFPEEYDLSCLVGIGFFSGTNTTGAIAQIPLNTYMATTVRYLAGIDQENVPQSTLASIRFVKNDFANICTIGPSASSVSGKSASLSILAYSSNTGTQYCFDPDGGVQFGFAYLV